MLHHLTKSVPTSWIKGVGRLQWKNPVARRTIDVVTRPLRRMDLTIARGAGKGLRFNAGGSHIGYVLGTTEPHVQDAFEKVIQPGMVFYDLGSSVGFHSLLAARLVGKTGFVHAFEPLEENMQQLRYNMKLNSITNFECHTVAVGDAESTVEFQVASARTHGKLVTLGAPEHVVGVRSVPMIRLDSLLDHEQTARPSVMKIDIEGAEVMALRGAQRTLTESRPVLFVDLHGTNNDIVDLLSSLDYQAAVLSPTHRNHDIRSAPWSVCIVAAPREKAATVGTALGLSLK